MVQGILKVLAMLLTLNAGPACPVAPGFRPADEQRLIEALTGLTEVLYHAARLEFRH